MSDHLMGCNLSMMYYLALQFSSLFVFIGIIALQFLTGGSWRIRCIATSPSVYINDIVRKAHAWANMIHRCFISQNVTLLVRVFVTYLCPLLEYNCVVWSPGPVRDIMLIEQVQRRFTKRLWGFCNISYGEHLAV